MDDSTGQHGYEKTRFKLLMEAHYPPTESKRAEAIQALVSFCVEALDYRFLVKLSKDESLRELQEASKNSILEAAFKSCAYHKSDEPLHDVATMADLPTELRKCATMALIERIKTEIRASSARVGPEDTIGPEAKLRRISIDERYPYDERIVAGLELAKFFHKSEDSAGLIFMMAERKHPRKAIMHAGTWLFDMCVKNGDYKLLEGIKPEGLPLDLQFILEDKINAAKKQAEELKSVPTKRYGEDKRLDARLITAAPGGAEPGNQIENERLATHDAWTPDITYRQNHPPAPRASPVDPRERPTLKTPYSGKKPPVPR